NGSNLLTHLTRLLSSLIGTGKHCIGTDVLFYMRVARRKPDDKLDNKYLEVGKRVEGQPLFHEFAGGLAEENANWLRYAEERLPRRRRGLEHGITYINDRPMLPETRPEWSGIQMVQVLQVYFQATWDYAHREFAEVPVLLTADIVNRLVSLGWPAPDLSQVTGATMEKVVPLWSKIRAMQDTEARFSFEPVDDSEVDDRPDIPNVNEVQERSRTSDGDGRKSDTSADEEVDELAPTDEDEDEVVNNTAGRLARTASRLEGISDDDEAAADKVGSGNESEKTDEEERAGDQGQASRRATRRNQAHKRGENEAATVGAGGLINDAADAGKEGEPDEDVSGDATRENAADEVRAGDQGQASRQATRRNQAHKRGENEAATVGAGGLINDAADAGEEGEPDEDVSGDATRENAADEVRAGDQGQGGPSRRATQRAQPAKRDRDDDAAPGADASAPKKRKVTGGRGSKPEGMGEAEGTEGVAQNVRQPRVRKPTSKAAEAASMSAARQSSQASRGKGRGIAASK
ncbi:hypothetical protein EVJ58_g11112, partial [Rhodofomes roseus]